MFLIGAAVSVPALALQLGEPGDLRFTVAGGRAGFVLAVVYVTGLSLLWATPARRVLAAVFEPLGRMSLNCYVSASVIVVPVGAVAGLEGSTALGPALVLCVVVSSVALGLTAVTRSLRRLVRPSVSPHLLNLSRTA